MAAPSTSLSRLTEDWPHWGTMFGEGRFALPDVLRILDIDRMRVEEYAEGGSRVIRAELPGMDPEKDIQVTMTDGVLQIEAHREQREETKEPGQFRSEFHYGSFVRRLPLPPTASEDTIEATYHDGILQVRIPVEEETGPGTKSIPVART